MCNSKNHDFRQCKLLLSLIMQSLWSQSSQKQCHGTLFNLFISVYAASPIYIVLLERYKLWRSANCMSRRMYVGVQAMFVHSQHFDKYTLQTCLKTSLFYTKTILNLFTCAFIIIIIIDFFAPSLTFIHSHTIVILLSSI